MRPAVFVDYDGTITDVDTFDVLVRHYAGAGAWEALEDELAAGEITLKQAMERQAAFVRGSIEDADRLLQEHVTVDPSFVPFAHTCLERGIPLMILSSGLAPLIERALRRNGAPPLPLVAADILIDESGLWTLRYPSDSPNGTDKAALVQRARDDGFETVFVGDGPSDYAAARIADRRFAKRANSLERYLANEGLAFTPFTSFADVQVALF